MINMNDFDFASFSSDMNARAAGAKAILAMLPPISAEQAKAVAGVILHAHGVSAATIERLALKIETGDQAGVETIAASMAPQIGAIVGTVVANGVHMEVALSRADKAAAQLKATIPTDGEKALLAILLSACPNGSDHMMWLRVRFAALGRERAKQIETWSDRLQGEIMNLRYQAKR